MVERSRGVPSGNQTWLCLKLPMTDVSPRQPLAAMFDDQKDGQPAFPIITRPGKHTKINGKSRKFTIYSWVDHIPICHEYSMNIPWIIRIHPHVMVGPFISKNCSLVIDGQGIICRLQCIGPMAQLDCGLRRWGAQGKRWYDIIRLYQSHQQKGIQNMNILHASWWYTYPSEKYEFVSWDDEIPNWMGK